MNTDTVQQEVTKKLPQLVKGSATYKLIVPEKVEEKIRYLLRKFPSTEWSGVLFISHKGTFENNDLVITCEDLYPMDLGTSGWTEFKMSEDVAAYMAENIELFDCETGLVHSHHQLGAFFSGQDDKMLQQEGNDTNCFVSLVVDTKGTYVARVTRKVQTKSEVTIKKLGTSYEFFGEGSKEITHDDTEVTKTIDKEVIEYFDLEVERHEVPNTLGYLDARFDEIVSKKNARNRRDEPLWLTSPQKEVEDKEFMDWLHNPDYKKDPYKPSQKEDRLPFAGEEDKNFELSLQWRPNAKEIHKAVVNMITCNLIINPDKFDFKQWVTRHMMNMYRKIFGESSIHEAANESSGKFTEWRDFIVQFTIDNFNTNDIPDELFSNADLFQSRIAEAMMDELREFENPNNPYITAYCNSLELYLVE